MLKGLTRPLWLLVTALLVVIAIAGSSTAHAGLEAGASREGSLEGAIATAPAPPALVPAILNGEPIQVLYITRSEDKVLVRCYPGYEPTLAVRSRGGDPSDSQQEGILSCTSASESAS